MTNANNRSPESFIPYRRSELIELCLADGRLDAQAGVQFRQFCEILAAFYHFRAHGRLERLKERYAPFDPDAENAPLNPPGPDELPRLAAEFADGVSALLAAANFTPLSQEELAQAFEVASLIPLQTSVDFDDYEQVRFFYRGEGEETVSFRSLLRRRRSLRIDNFRRVAVLLKFRDHDHFANRKRPADALGFVPGRIYLYLYKNIPRNDLELIFPNVKVSMNWKDRLMLLVPALGAAIPLLLKILPSLGLLVAAVLLFTMGPEITERFGYKDVAASSIYPLLAALLSIGAALGGFAMHQYTKYKSKRLMFLKKVTETLFFKNLVSNEGVLYSLADAAEEELCKEAILVCYHLLTSGEQLDRDRLDARIEEWLFERSGARVDFDIDKTLANLEELQAELPATGGGEARRALLTREASGVLRVLPLEDAKRLVDYIWDHAFEYANG